MAKIKTFISFDNKHKDKKIRLQNFINKNHDMEDVSLDYQIEATTNEAIRQKIRDSFITDATVLILIATKDARGRKFVDWEIAAAMYDGEKRADGKRNDICGIVVVDYVENNIRTLESAIKRQYEHFKGRINWVKLSDSETRKKYEYLPERIVDSMVMGADIAVIPSSYVEQLLPEAIRKAHEKRSMNKGKYKYNDLRRHNSPRQEIVYSSGNRWFS